MNISKKVSAFLAALGMILAGLVAGFLSPASAATPITTFTNNASLTVDAGTGVDISNRSLIAIPLGYYTSAVPKEGAENTLESVTVKQVDAATDAKIRDALVAANLVKNTNGTYTANITCSEPFDTNNYAGWVAGCLHDSTTTPWAGQLRNFVTQLAPNLSGGTALSPVTGEKNKQSVSTLTPGIYLVLDKTTTEGVTPSIPMLASTGVGTYNKLGTQPLGSVEYKAIDKPDYDKNILEDGNEPPTPADYTDDDKKKHNQVNIGETVTYELTATVPPTAGYSSFWLELADTLSKGLTYGEIKSVKAGTTALTADTDYKVIGDGTQGAVAADTDGTTSFRILFAPKADTTETSGFASDLLQSTEVATKFAPGTKITVVYTATLNGDAVIESTGNPNELKLVYSNNPTDSTKKKTTPPVETRTYTGQFSVCKKDMAGTALTGAKFSLSEGSTAINLVKVSDGKYRPASTTTDAEGTTTVTEADVNITTGCLEFVGLKSGDYVLKETVAPSGFSSTFMPTVTFTLTVTQPADDDDLSKAYSTLAEKSGDSNNLVDLAAERNVEVTPELGNGIEVAHEAVTTKVQDQAVVKNVHNITELPKTGAAWLGIFAGGAVLFAALGGALMYMGRRHANS